MSTPDLELSLPARAENVAVVRHAFGGFGDAYGVDDQTLSDIKLAVTEACTNVVRHAYDSPLASYTATAFLDGDAIALEVRDNGCWRPQGRGDGGHGIPLMRKLSDQLEIDSGNEGTTVRLRVACAGTTYAAVRSA